MWQVEDEHGDRQGIDGFLRDGGSRVRTGLTGDPPRLITSTVADADDLGEVRGDDEMATPLARLSMIA